MAWTLDPAHSSLQFAVRHMMIANVRGEFERFTVQVDADEQNPLNSKVLVEVDASSINTRNEQRDGHLKSPDFLDVATYPTITFKSTRIEQVDQNHGRLIGELTIRGVTREVTLDVEYTGQSQSPWGTTSAGFSVEGKINRRDWGLTWNQALETGGVLVGDEVKITAEVELVKQVEQVEAATA